MLPDKERRAPFWRDQPCGGGGGNDLSDGLGGGLGNGGGLGDGGGLGGGGLGDWTVHVGLTCENDDVKHLQLLDAPDDDETEDCQLLPEYP